MSRNINRSNSRNQIINIPEHENIFSNKGISFNYSENINHVTELTTENFQDWKADILDLLIINNLEKYVSLPKVKKLRKKDIKENLDKYVPDKFNKNLVYDIGTTQVDIKNDIMTKWIISNSLGKQTKGIIKGHSKTAHEMWNFRHDSFTVGNEHQKMILQNKLDRLKFTTDDDIHIFLATLQNIIDELEIIDTDMSDSVKVGILNRALPENLRWVNVFQYNDEWVKRCNYVKRIILDIIFSNIKERKLQEENPKYIFNVQMESKNRPKSKYIKIKRRKNGRCFLCGKYGHYKKECIKYKRNKFFKQNHKNKSIKTQRKINTKHVKKNDDKYIYSLSKSNSYEDNYSEDFSKDYNSDNAIEINSLEVANNINNNNNNKITITL